MAGFVQIIEIQTSRIDEIEALVESMRARREAQGGPTPQRATLTADRDRPGHYLNVIEFDSHESAMENSRRPDTSEFAEQLAKLCDGPPTFRNLDVRKTWGPSSS
jgi:quinol monooxygenase YgiN